jgi:hypothetical protein
VNNYDKLLPEMLERLQNAEENIKFLRENMSLSLQFQSIQIGDLKQWRESFQPEQPWRLHGSAVTCPKCGQCVHTPVPREVQSKVKLGSISASEVVRAANIMARNNSREKDVFEAMLEDFARERGLM